MEDKIKAYVTYQFRFKKGEEKTQLVEEVLSNLLERYETLKETYQDEERAYRETIARVGDFSSLDVEKEPRYTLSPGLYDVGLLVAMVLSVFGVVALVLQGGLAFIITMISVVLFVGSAYYTYHKAQYEKDVNGDIELFHLYLDKSFSYLKTSFIFWGISFSVLFGQLLAGIILFIMGANDPLSVMLNIGEFIMLYLFMFVISSLIVGFVFYMIYQKIIEHYTYLSGKDSLKGSFSKGFGLVKSSSGISKNTYEKLVLGILLFTGLVSLIATGNIHEGSSSTEAPMIFFIFRLLLPRNYFLGILLLVPYTGFFILAVKKLMNKSVEIKKVILMYATIFVGYFLVAIIGDALVTARLFFDSAFNPITTIFVSVVAVLIITLVYNLFKGSD